MKTYKEDADKEVAGILEEKQKAAFDKAQPFTIDWRPEPLSRFSPDKEKTPPSQGSGERGKALKSPQAGSQPEGESSSVPGGGLPCPGSKGSTENSKESDGEGKGQKEAKTPSVELKAWNGPTVTLSLADALYLSTRNSRDYQTRKEDVFLSALSLSLDRHRWDFIFSGKLDGAYTRQNGETSASGHTDFGVTKLLSEGGSVGLSIGTSFLRFVTGEPRQSFLSSVSASLSLPLLKGAGRTVAREALTQSERNTVYSLRDFRRYCQTFAVSIATGYYNVLQQKDQLKNEKANYDSLKLARERTEALAEAGRLPEFQVDQARQDELRARDRMVRSEQSYKQALDGFKVTLGLRTDANVELDPRELERLARIENEKMDINDREAVSVAFKKRMDFLNTMDELEDARRKITVAENGFLPELNLVGGASFGSKGPNNVANLRPRDGTYSLGLDIDLNLDKKEERNLYRQALITYDRTKRRVQDEADRIKLAIRNAFRSLDQARKSYAIQKQSVTLAERRVESTNMLLEAGKATTRDLLESQSALLDAQNSLTRDLIDINVTRMELFSDMGVLEIDECGMIRFPSTDSVKESAAEGAAEDNDE